MTAAIEQLVNAVLDRNVSGDELEHVVVTTQMLQEIACELQLHVRGLGVRILLDDRIKEPFQVVSKKQRLVMERLTGKTDEAAFEHRTHGALVDGYFRTP